MTKTITIKPGQGATVGFKKVGAISASVGQGEARSVSAQRHQQTVTSISASVGQGQSTSVSARVSR